MGWFNDDSRKYIKLEKWFGGNSFGLNNEILNECMESKIDYVEKYNNLFSKNISFVRNVMHLNGGLRVMTPK